MFVVHDITTCTSPRFAVGIHIPQRRVVLEVGFSRPCGKAFRQEGRDFLQLVDFDIRQGAYEEALDLLDDHYGRGKHIFVKTQNFCFVCQTSGENEREYHVRVERLSRDADLDTTDEAGKRLCLVFSIQ